MEYRAPVFVAARPFSMMGQSYAKGARVNVTGLSARKVQQLAHSRRIQPASADRAPGNAAS